MFDEKLKLRQPVAANFFESAIKANKLHHAYMLTGPDPLEQYYLAIQVAKTLNCSNKSDIGSCTCTNCSWIRQNRHPAVITISPKDYTYGNDKSKSSTVISVNQVRYLINTLGTSSPYNRVIIFTDAVEGAEYARKAESLWGNYLTFLSPPVSAESENTERASWLPLPIRYETFHPAAPNTLLKTLEEPNPNILFFFLTRDKEDMLETIVSRSQIVPVLGKNNRRVNSDVLSDFFRSFPPKDHSDAILLAEQLITISKKEAYTLEDLLDIVQEYLYQIVKTNTGSKEYVARIINYIERVECAKIEIINYVNPQAAIDSLFLSFVK